MIKKIPCHFGIHDFRVVALDRSYTSKVWDRWVDRNEHIEHLVGYMKCERCQKRDFSYLDLNKEHIRLAKQNRDIFVVKKMWLDGGIIEAGFDNFHWIDRKFAPVDSLYQRLQEFKDDPNYRDELEKNPTIKNMVENLEVMIKLAKDN